MCRPASFIVTKTHVFWSKNDESHEVIIEENGLQETNVRSEIRFVRVEVLPPNDDFRKPFSKWEYHLDQDMLPEWYDAKKVEARVRKCLKEWRKCKVVMPREKRSKIAAGEVIAVYGTIKDVRDSATIKYVGGSATIEYVGGSATIKDVGGSATIEYVGGSATIKDVGGSATIEYVRDLATIEYVGGSATIKDVRDSATIKYVGGSATIKDVGGSATIEYVGGSATIEYVGGSATIKDVGDSATIKDVRDSATIIAYKSLTPNILKSSRAVLVDRSKDVVQCFVGKPAKAQASP